ncbi:hypothetical protein V6N12_019994 [Hibiscus sabdariffa]|uniref:HMA domain-containing protein n=1 Tax=Hibiscus sabdariffa TaxID=183260 RepID=A0ABR2B7Z6_9ROSI
MGEESKQEQPPVEEKPAEVKKEEPPLPPPPPPLVLFVDLHCVGCAKKVERTIMKIRGVEGVVIDITQNQVTVKGVIEPQAICAKIMKKTKRRAKLLSPLPAAEGQPMPELVTSQAYKVRRTKKQARIVPQPEPEKQDEKKEGEEKPSEEPKPEEKPEKKEEEPLAEEKEATAENREEEKNEDEYMKKMIYYYQPLYVMERIPPAPQLFSDENPNACCIS